MNIKNRIDLLKPICYLNSSEEYFPISLKLYLDNCKIKKGDNIVDLDLVNENYVSDKNEKFELIPQGPNNQNPEKNSIFLGNTNINQVPYIVKINNNNDNTTDIIFFFFFGYNGEVVFLFNLIKEGSHYSDIEHIVMKVDTNKFNNISNSKNAFESILSVYYSAHSGGTLVLKNDLETENNRVVIYIANKTHASYPKKGLYLRLYGVGNDHVEKFYRWFPNNLFIVDNNNDILLNNFVKKYKGTMGFDHVTGFAGKSYFNGGSEEIIPQGIRIEPEKYNIILYIILFILFYSIIKSYDEKNYKIMIIYILFFILAYSLKTVKIE